MNILFVGSLVPQRNGAARSCSEVVSLLAESGHRVRALAPITPEFSDIETFDREAHAGVSVRRFHVPYFESFMHPPPR
jgi:hypothetical protein